VRGTQSFKGPSHPGGAYRSPGIPIGVAPTPVSVPYSPASDYDPSGRKRRFGDVDSGMGRGSVPGFSRSMRQKPEDWYHRPIEAVQQPTALSQPLPPTHVCFLLFIDCKDSSQLFFRPKSNHPGTWGGAPVLTQQPIVIVPQPPQHVLQSQPTVYRTQAAAVAAATAGTWQQHHQPTASVYGQQAPSAYVYPQVCVCSCCTCSWDLYIGYI